MSIFVVIEGIDGSGKTTLAKALNDKLESENIPVVLSREPTKGPHGKKIRELTKVNRPSPEEELRLFVEDRKEHVRDVIFPSLKDKKAVILDRYYYSTMAYQGASGISMDHVKKAHEDFIIDPDLLVILDLEVDEALARIEGRGAGDGFEKKDFLEKVLVNYRAIKHHNLLILDASSTTEEMLEDIWTTLCDMGIK